MDINKWIEGGFSFLLANTLVAAYLLADLYGHANGWTPEHYATIASLTGVVVTLGLLMVGGFPPYTFQEDLVTAAGESALATILAFFAAVSFSASIVLIALAAVCMLFFWLFCWVTLNSISTPYFSFINTLMPFGLLAAFYIDAYKGMPAAAALVLGSFLGVQLLMRVYKWRQIEAMFPKP
jgi:hypothetical protein